MAGSEHIAGSGRRSAADARQSAIAGARRERLVLVVVFVAVIGLDQAVKWLAWRRLEGSLINTGGYILLGPEIRSWFAGPVSGALTDVIGGVALVIGVRRLLHRRRPMYVLIGGGLIAAGWASNILDRLGVHYWTAPGSARGVIDFIPSGGASRCNVADLWIVVGTLLLGYAFARHRLTGEPRDGAGPGSTLRSSGANRVYARIAVLIALLAFITLAVTSAMNHGGLYSPAARA
jgi:lipoprotein signal peptidase